ncbi:hypothetical protein [Actinorugispora endophytica]|uniref:hypothetical protein n=1 Tax=Actinorugispora endophytica TaxID=1605990 RepID=UPI0014151BD8|nr:hypothetical protein [Actinorugispora endophytica]
MSTLPVVVSAFGAAPEELCGDCRGRGIVAGGEEAVNLLEGLGICGCMTPYSLWWDYRRETFAYPHTVKASAMEWVGGRPIAYDYVVCDSCDIEQVSISSGAGLVQMPWRPDCGRCGDTGWLHVGTDTNPVFPEDV